jgi:hypothetical protein
MWDEQVDQAIDEEARRATDGAPSTRFRTRVLERIEADTPRPSWRAAWIVAPVAAAAAILIAVAVVHEQRDRTTVRLKADTTETRKPVANPGSVGGDAGSVRLQPDRVAGRVRLQADRSSRPAPPASDVDPIAVAPLTVDALTPAPIAIEPLDAVAPLTLAPLDMPDVQRRNE